MSKKKRSRYGNYTWLHPVTKKLYARVFVKDGGKWKTILRPAENKTHAKQLAKEIKEGLSKSAEKFIKGESMTFNQLAEWYKQNIAIPQVRNSEGTVVKGMATYESIRNRISRLQVFLGEKRIKDITEDVLQETKQFLFDESERTSNKKPKVSSVNRYLENLRTVLNAAIRQRWLKESPFDYGVQVIEKALEEKRDVTITPADEDLILSLSSGLLHYVILCLVETGARPSEIYEASSIIGEPVEWSFFFDYDFEAVKLVSYKGKKRKERLVPVTEKLKIGMMELWDSLEVQDKKRRIFPFRSFNHEWLKVRKKAGLEGLRLRDLRRSFSSKLARLGISPMLQSELLGHDKLQTTFDYTKADMQAVRLAKTALDNIQEIEVE